MVRSNQATSKHRLLGIATAAVLLAFISKSLAQSLYPFWLDEASTVWFAQQSWASLWLEVPAYESHPPLYYSIIKIWFLLTGDAVGLSARWPSLLATLLFVPLSWMATTSKDSRTPAAALYTAPLICLALLSFHPLLLEHAINARQYLFFAISYGWAFVTLLRIHQSARPTFFMWASLVVSTALTIWFHNTGAIFALSLGIATLVLLTHRARSDRRLALGMIGSAMAILILSLPWLFMAIPQATQWGSGSWVPEPSLASVIHTLSALYSFWPFDAQLKAALPESWLADIVRITLLGAGSALPLILLDGLFRENRLSEALAWSIGIYLPVFLLIAVSILGPDLFILRVLIPALIPALIASSLAIANYFPVGLKLPVTTAVISLTLFSYTHHLFTKYNEPWDEITRHTAAQQTLDSNQTEPLLLTLPNTLELPLSLYNAEGKSNVQIIALPTPFPNREPHGLFPMGTTAVPALSRAHLETLKQALARRSTVSVLTRNTALYDPEQILPKALEACNYSQTSSQSWAAIKLTRYQRPSVTPCS